MEETNIEESRKLTTEELYTDLQKKNKSLCFEIGQLKSHIDELIFENINLKKQLEGLKASDQETIKEVRKESMYQVIREHTRKLEKKIQHLRETNSELITKLNQNDPKK